MKSDLWHLQRGKIFLLNLSPHRYVKFLLRVAFGSAISRCISRAFFSNFSETMYRLLSAIFIQLSGLRYLRTRPGALNTCELSISLLTFAAKSLYAFRENNKHSDCGSVARTPSRLRLLSMPIISIVKNRPFAREIFSEKNWKASLRMYCGARSDGSIPICP